MGFPTKEENLKELEKNFIKTMKSMGFQVIDPIEIETHRKESSFWKYIVPIFLVLAVGYFIIRLSI